MGVNVTQQEKETRGLGIQGKGFKLSRVDNVEICTEIWTNRIHKKVAAYM